MDPFRKILHLIDSSGQRFVLVLNGLHQQVFTAVIVVADERLALWNQVTQSHTFKPRVAQRLCHGTLQSHAFGKRGADAQQVQHITRTQRGGQSFDIQRDSLHLTGGRLPGVDPLEQGHFGGGERVHTTAGGQ